MRIALSLNAAGDIRLRMLRDIKASSKISAPGGAALVCSSELQEMTTPAEKLPKVGYGRISKGTTFGSGARKFIREAGAVVDRQNRQNCVFLTGTLPGSTVEAFRSLAAWSGWVAAAAQNWVRDYAPDSLCFGVWEYQKRGALHLHICVATQSASQAARLKSLWKARWIKLLLAVRRRANTDVFRRSDGRSWVDTPWVTRTDAQTVEKSVACYLAKYLSKGSVSARNKSLYPPSRWWFASKELREAVKADRRVLEISNLPPIGAQDIFERISGELAAHISRLYLYTSPCDAIVKGCIALAKPIQASMIFEQISVVFDALQPGIRVLGNKRKATTGDIILLFGGQILGPQPG